MTVVVLSYLREILTVKVVLSYLQGDEVVVLSYLQGVKVVLISPVKVVLSYLQGVK